MHTSDGLLTLITAFINEAQNKRCRLHHLLVMHLDYNLTMALCKFFYLLTYLLVAFDPHVVTTFLSPVFLLLQQH